MKNSRICRIAGGRQAGRGNSSIPAGLRFSKRHRQLSRNRVSLTNVRRRNRQVLWWKVESQRLREVRLKRKWVRIFRMRTVLLIPPSTQLRMCAKLMFSHTTLPSNYVTRTRNSKRLSKTARTVFAGRDRKIQKESQFLTADRFISVIGANTSKDRPPLKVTAPHMYHRENSRVAQPTSGRQKQRVEVETLLLGYFLISVTAKNNSRRVPFIAFPLTSSTSFSRTEI